MFTKAVSRAMALLLMIFGFWIADGGLLLASILDPSPPHSPWWSSYWAQLATSNGLGGLGLGFAMIAVGRWLLVVSRRS
jgi:hypothetical protein